MVILTHVGAFVVGAVLSYLFLAVNKDKKAALDALREKIKAEIKAELK